MKKSVHLILAAFLLCAGILAAPAARAQQSKSSRIPRYDKTTEVTTSGTIQAIERQQDATTVPGTYLTLQTVPITFPVHMGMLSASKMPFHVGDQVQVTGSLITVGGGKQILLARTVTSATQTVTVRTTGGQPLRPTALASATGGSR
jgi:hypothetical protein